MRAEAIASDYGDMDAGQHCSSEAGEGEREAFARRQRNARRRITQLLVFYREHPCHMARTHLLAACAITLGRFCGYSEAFDRIGEALMPLTPEGALCTPLWEAYAADCKAGRPWEVREERWLAAHMADLRAIQAEGLEQAFAFEAEQHRNDPTWQLLRQHMEVTLGTRRLEAAALAGMVAYETAMAQSMTQSLGRLFTAGWRLLGRYAWETARAFLLPERTSQDAYIGYRRCAWELLYYAITAWTASRIYRRGVRQCDRGSKASEDGWPLLAEVLGDRVGEVHPLIERFYRNPGGFQVKAKLQLHTVPAKFWTRLATLLTGQGLYEADLPEMEARFRAFRRADGSMHFLRELYCGETLRVFDSDFVVRKLNGCPTLFEVFPDLQLAVEMEVLPLPEGGLCIRGRHITLRGVRLPSFGLTVEFHSHVEPYPEGERLEITGALRMQPRTAFGRFLAFRLLRRPETLGSIHYRAQSPVHASGEYANG
ncbi:MAG TPA: hypothetical protein VKU00_27805 [Chthonomonadaceae bacterium]|nr:hypothetical protein [Chthonomonadaceae bacterium]